MMSLKKLCREGFIGLIATAFFSMSFAGNDNSTIIACPGNSGVENSKQFVYCGPSLCTAEYDAQGKPTGKANCKDCYRMTGENFGSLSCEQRVPNNDILISSFSPRKAVVEGPLKQPIIFCDTSKGADSSYADCLNARCQVTDSKTGQSTCLCKVVTTKKGGVFGTQARSCDVNKCNASAGYLLNGAPAEFVAPLVLMISQKTQETSTDITCDTYKPDYIKRTKAIVSSIKTTKGDA